MPRRPKPLSTCSAEHGNYSCSTQTAGQPDPPRVPKGTRWHQQVQDWWRRRHLRKR